MRKEDDVILKKFSRDASPLHSTVAMSPFLFSPVSGIPPLQRSGFKLLLIACEWEEILSILIGRRPGKLHK